MHIIADNTAQAHGGYTFCGVAALVLLNRLELIDQRSLLVRVRVRVYQHSLLVR